MKIISKFLFIYLFMFSCGSEPQNAIDSNLTAIRNHFNPQTHFKQIVVNVEKQDVIILDSVQKEYLREFEFRNKQWRSLGKFNYTIKGNVKFERFFFRLDSTHIGFLKKSLEKIQKNAKITSIKLASLDSYKAGKTIEIVIDYSLKNTSHQLIFNY